MVFKICFGIGLGTMPKHRTLTHTSMEESQLVQASTDKGNGPWKHSVFQFVLEIRLHSVKHHVKVVSLRKRIGYGQVRERIASNQILDTARRRRRELLGSAAASVGWFGPRPWPLLQFHNPQHRLANRYGSIDFVLLLQRKYAIRRPYRRSARIRLGISGRCTAGPLYK